jgi:nucleoside-diphosphate-sugar epimerase
VNSLVLLTGASGWLGRRLALAAARGLPDVPALAGSASGTLRCLVASDEDAVRVRRVVPDAECVRGDLRDPASLEEFGRGAEGGLHCAGVIHPRRVREFYAVNVDGTRALLTLAERRGVRRFVHVSSNSPLGCNPDRAHRFDETSPYRPYGHYGRSKKLAEDLVNEAGARGSLEVSIARAPWFYGPGQPERQIRFFQMIEQGRMPLVGGGANLRSMVYVDNLCQGLLLCARHPAARNKTFWIADRRPYPMREIVETVADVLEQDFGRRVRRRWRDVPGLVSELALLADRAIQGVGLYQQEIHVLSEMNKDIACTIARAERDLGYAPAIELREGMRRSIASLLDDGGSLSA